MATGPTTVVATNVNVMYGCLEGNKTTDADAVRAYVQSLLKSKHRTFVKIPKELWPPEWFKKGYKNPVCLLVRALYGHPEAGAHWERHLVAIIVDKMGGAAVDSHPSTYWFEESKLMLTIYVDDLMLSGPEGAHAPFWEELAKDVHIEEPEPLDRFLGRHHVISECEAPSENVIESFYPTVLTGADEPEGEG